MSNLSASLGTAAAVPAKAVTVRRAGPGATVTVIDPAALGKPAAAAKPAAPAAPAASKPAASKPAAKAPSKPAKPATAAAKAPAPAAKPKAPAKPAAAAKPAPKAPAAPAKAPAKAKPAAPAAKERQYTIDKDRPEQNGKKRPSANTFGGKMWAALEALEIKQGNTLPTLEQAVELGKGMKGNETSATISYYRWRKFWGIRGRQ